MERWEAKIVSLLLIFLLPFIFTLLPYKLSGYFGKKGAQGKKVLSCLMCFGGGVFFATFMLHLGPEVRLMLHTSLLVPYNIHYPIPDLSMAFGFFFVLYVEKFAIRFNTKRQLRKNKSFSTNDSPEKQDGVVFSKDSVGNQKTNGYIVNDTSKKDDGHAIDITTEFLGQATDAANVPAEQHSHSHGHSHMHGVPNADGVVVDLQGARSLILMLALSLHRIFDGMGVGLQTRTQNVWNLLVAIVCHEVVIGFSLGLDFMKNNFTWRRLLITALLCSLIMPVGILIGIGISEFGNETSELQIINGLLQGLTCGTFIYVTFMEILHEEMSAMDTSLAKVTSVLAGFGLMALLSAVPEGGSAVMVAENTTTVTRVVSEAAWASTVAY